MIIVFEFFFDRHKVLAIAQLRHKTVEQNSTTLVFFIPINIGFDGFMLVEHLFKIFLAHHFLLLFGILARVSWSERQFKKNPTL